MKPWATIILAIGIGLAVGFGCSVPSHAQEDRVTRAMTIFTEACGQFAGKPAELRVHLAQRFQRMPGSEEKELLEGYAGQVWHTPEPKPDQRYTVYSYDDGECAVEASDMPANPMRAVMRGLFFKFGRADSSHVELRSDKVVSGSDQETRTFVFVASKQNEKRGVQYMLVTLTNKEQQLIRLSTTLTDMTP